MSTTETMGKGLLCFASSPYEIVSLLQQLEKRLLRVQQMPSESMIYAMQPVIEALIAKELSRHPDMDVNISVACCISEVFRIMVYKTPYSDEQMKDFFELVVITLEKLSFASGGGYNRMVKALETLDKGKFSLMMCDLQLDGLIARLFRQFLTVADSNSPAVVIKMKQIMVMILEKMEPVNHMLVDLLVTSVRKENKIASPVCWQLGRDVLNRCATQLKPHLPKKVAEKVYSPLMETIPSTTGTCKLGNDATRKRKLECLDGSRNMVRPVRGCRDVKKHEKKTISTDDPPMPTKSVTEVLYDDGEELLDLKQEQWKLAETASRLSTFTFEVKLMNAGKGLLIMPSSTAELLNVLEQMKKLIHRVQLHKAKQTLSESMKYAMRPIIEALVAKELLRHSDTDVNISVACCICEVFRIMVYETPYNDEQMKDFFELVVITFEKLSSGSGRCYDRMIKVLTTLDSGKFSVMMCDLQLDGLIVRLFKQFLTVSDSNSLAVVIKIKKIMAMIIEKTELVNHKLVDLLVNNVREDNKTSSPVCWQLGRDVLMKCAAQLKPHLPKKVAEEVYSPSMETILSTTRKRKLECLDGRRNMVRPVRCCQDVKKHEKKTISTDDPPMPTKSVTEAQSVEHGENLVGRRIKVWWPRDKTYYQGVVNFFDCRNKRHKVLYADGEEELLDLKQEQWKLAETASRLSTFTFEVKLMNAGKGLLIMPSSTAELLNVLEQMKKLLHRVQLHKAKQTLSESMKYAMRPIIEALVAKELLRHPDIDVNISVACCICDVLRIMDYNASYNDEQMKDFFELAVITFEKLSSSGGCYTKLFKVLITLSRLSYSLLKSDLLLKRLIGRLFKQFITSAGSNSSGAVFKMKQIMINIIEQSELLDLELVDLLVTSVRNENQITSPVCWKLGDEVLKKCAAKLKPHLPDQVAKEECNSLGESIYSTANTSRNRVQPVRSCKDATWHMVNLLHINSEVEKNHENKTLSSHDPPMPSTSVIEVSSDDDNEELINLTGKQWELLEKVSATPDSVSFDNGDESFMDLTQEELVENVAHSVGQAPPPGDIISVQGYSVKKSIAPILEAIFKKHGNILADCFFQEASVITTFLEVICEVARLIETSDVTTIISKMEEIEFQVSEADAANIDVSWLQAQLKDIHTRNEALEKTNSLMEMKANTILVKRAARTDLIERCEELVAAQERCAKIEECIKGLDLVEDKPIGTIIAKRAARADLRERCRELVVAQEQFANAERCVKVLDLIEEKLSNNIEESKAENTHG